MADGGGGRRWCVVTGGRGFAARHLVEFLLKDEGSDSDGWSVRVADLGPEIELDRCEDEGVLGGSLRSGRAAYFSVDLRHKAQVVRVFKGAEVVFHMAAPNSSINNYQLHYSVNVQGTKNVIDACIECDVKRLIYTSSSSVVFDGVHGIFNAIETMPYPVKFNDSYSETKAEAEKLVRKANGRGGLLTCCLRPSGIFGPGDKLLVPSLVTAARSGKSKYVIGDGNNLCDFTYVENVAYGHVCAERTLAIGGTTAEKVAGQVYFITNMEPIKFWEFMSRILEGLGYERPNIKIPVSVIMPIARVVEWVYKIFGPYGMPVPQFTPSRMRLLSCNRTFSSSKAEDQLGYTPIISLEEGLQRTIGSYPHLKAEECTIRSSGKASSYLGDGKVAATLLWKDRNQTLTVLLLFAIAYYYFFVAGYTMITAAAKLLSLVTSFLLICGMLPAKVFGYKIGNLQLQPSFFYFSDEMSHHLALSLSSWWNLAAFNLRSLCKGKDWPLFTKVAAILFALSCLGSLSARRLFEIGVPLVFIAVYIYDKLEYQIDGFLGDIHSRLLKLKSGF